MPSTRSQGQVQPMLQFPRRRSCRASSRVKTPKPQNAPLSSPAEPEPQPAPLTRIGPLSPRRPTDLPAPLTWRCLTEPPASPEQPGARLTPLSRTRPAGHTPPAPGTRLPLSPRKRTGECKHEERRGQTVLDQVSRQLKGSGFCF